MQPFSIQTTLTLDDWRTLQHVCALRVRQLENPAKAWRIMALWCLVTIASFALFDALGIQPQPLPMLAGILFGVVVTVSAYRRSVRAAQPRDGSDFFKPSTHEIGPNGIASTQQGAYSFRQWRRVTDVSYTAEHIFIWIDRLSAYVIPVRDLPEGVTTDQFGAACMEWMAAPAAEEPIASTADVPVAAATTQPASPAVENTGSAWRTVFRLLTLRTVQHPGRSDSALSGKPVPIAVLVLVSLVLWVGLTWFYYLPTPEFYPFSAPALSWYALAAMAVAFVLAKRSHPQVAIARVYSLLAILLPVLVVADFAIVMLVPEQGTLLAQLILGLYAMAYCARGLHALSGNRQPVAVMGAFALTVLFFWGAASLYVYPSVWTLDDSEYAEEATPDLADPEALLFEQPARIDAAVAQIERATGDVPKAFFVGFAGYGDQRVFAEEIKYAAGKFAERYDLSGRSLLLINDQRDREAQPLATVSGLGYALKGIASRMRVDEDVLFLTLSSHGSEDPLLSVENGELPLRDLSGAALADALRASGIKWRVIVISACHAGAFIEPLQDPYTIVITAAAPDRTSFGCSDERDLTYFGEAFFRDALPQAASLREAFDTATQLVGEREKQEGFEASKPQAFFGEQIEARLAPMLRVASEP